MQIVSKYLTAPSQNHTKQDHLCLITARTRDSFHASPPIFPQSEAAPIHRSTHFPSLSLSLSLSLALLTPIVIPLPIITFHLLSVSKYRFNCSWVCQKSELSAMLMAVKPPLASNGARAPLRRDPLGFCWASIPSNPLFLSLPLDNPIPQNCFCLKQMLPHSSRLTLSRRRLTPIAAVESDVPHSHHQGSETVKDSKRFEEWSSLTAKFSGAANIPFMLLQLPQIILNARNLLVGNKTALLAVPWLGMLTGLLGNLALLSYFAKKREKEAMVIQTLGVVTTYIVFAQLAIAGAMPLPYFAATSAVVASGLVINFMNYFNILPVQILKFWEDFITVGGFSVLPQVMWSTFVPFIPNSILPGITALVAALLAVSLARVGKLPEKGVKFVGALSGWTATFLFMWMPVSQLWTNYLNPENIKGLSALTMLLALIGNGLVLPRALFIRDFMWFLGSGWAVLSYGYANIVCLYCCKSVSREFFIAATAGLFSWIGFFFWKDSVVYGFRSPLTSLKELLFGS